MSKLMRCSLHGVEFEEECPKCNTKKKTKTTADYLSKLKGVAEYLEGVREAIENVSNINLDEAIQELYIVLDYLGKKEKK